MKYHTTMDGRKIPLEDLTLDHLRNILNYIEKRAKEGVDIQCSYEPGYDTVFDEPDYDTVFDDEALELLEYDIYKREFDKRLKSVFITY